MHNPACKPHCSPIHGAKGPAAHLLLALLASAALPAGNADAQSFPVKPVRVVSPFEAGGSNDGVIRLVAPRMGELLGQQVLVENRPGAGGVVGTDVVARAAPDGYTLVVGTTSTHAINPSLRKLPYDAERDFAPVGLIGISPYVMLVNPSLPVKSVKDMIVLAKKNPGAIEFGSGGIGTPGHLAGAVFARQIGAELTHVPYKSGASSITDVVAGRISMVFTTMIVADQLIQSGRVRALGVTTLNRLPRYPNLPTIHESGLPGFEFTLWLGLMAPAKTPEAAVNRLADALGGSLKDTSTQAALVKQSVEVLFEPPKVFGERIRRDLAFYAKVTREAGLKAE
jgi:tripartite-type tricarboxylate transporter receptor subunit TctC